MRPFFTALLALTVLGCVRSLPAVQPLPLRTLDVAAPPSGEHGGHVVLDVGPGRVRVDEFMTVNPHDVYVVKNLRTETISVPRTVLRTSASGNLEFRTEYETESRLVAEYGWEHVTDRRLVPLCEAPCVLELREGPHDLHLQAMDDRRWSNLHVEATSARRTYRVGLGHTLSGNDVLTQFLLGFVFLTPGTTLLAAAAVDWAAVGGEPTAGDHDRVQSDSVGLTVVGGVLLVAGIVGLVLVRPTEQQTVVEVESR